MHAAGSDFAEVCTRVGVFILLAIPSLYFIGRAFQSSSLARRLANFALACGLLWLVLPEYAFGINAVGSRTAFIAIQGVRIVLGLAGTAAAISALVLRRNVTDVGVGRCVTGLVLSCFLILFGAGVMATGIRLGPSAPRDQWTYHFSARDFDIIVPSKRWQVNDAPDGSVDMHRTDRPMRAKVQFYNGGREAWKMAGAHLRTLPVYSSARIDSLKFEEGVTTQGYPYQYISGIEKRTDVFVGNALIYREYHSDFVSVFFEAKLTAMSQTLRQTELAGAAAEAKTICLPNGTKPANP